MKSKAYKTSQWGNINSQQVFLPFVMKMVIVSQIHHLNTEKEDKNQLTVLKSTPLDPDQANTY